MTTKFGMRLGIVLFVALLAAGPVVLTTQARRDFGGAHWARTRNPFDLQVGDNVNGRWDRYLSIATRQWSSSDIVDMREVRGSTNPRACQPTNNQVQVCSARYGNTGWLGLTTLWANRKDHIVRATVQLNDTYFDSGRYSKPKAMRHTMCHELGHSLGLEHTRGRSCLNDAESSIFRDIRPTKRDFKDLQRLYRHRDGRAEARSAAMDEGPFEVTTIPDADTFDTNTTVRSEATGDGGRVITYITWIDEEKVD